MKKILALLLAISMLLSGVTTAFAEERDDSEPYSVPFEWISLEDFADIIDDDPDVYNVVYNSSTSTLTYTDMDDHEITIVESTSGLNSTWTITEDETTDVLFYNPVLDKVYINNIEVTATAVEHDPTVHWDTESENPGGGTRAFPNTLTYGGKSWTRIGRIITVDITAEKQIRLSTTVIVFRLLLAFLGYGGGPSYSLASAIINSFKNAYSTSKHIFAKRALYSDNQLPLNHYLHRNEYYRNAACTQFIRTVYYEFYSW
jgi:hypothetical protein